MPPALILADDATGALECASLLAACDPQFVKVIDTQSRHISPEQAAASILPYAHTKTLYKKTDSTLRGNIAAELTALLPRTVVYIAAYPNLGRTVRNGHLFIYNIPIHQTDFARDPRHPIHNSDIAALFPQAIKIPTAKALEQNLNQPGILICDAATNDDFTQLASVLKNTTAVIAGPAGFIPHWAQLHDFPTITPPTIPQPTNWLVICGSRHPQSRRQAARAREQNIPVVQTSDQPQPNPAAVVEDLALQAKQQIEKQNPDGVLIMGGDTVFALWRALGITEITPLPERLPGIAASWSPQRQILFLTKAGGFGDDSLINKIIHP